MTPRYGSWWPLLLWAGVLCTAGCSSGAPRRTYLLTPPIAPTAPSTTTPALRLEVRRILIPDYLDSPDILMRSGSDEVKASATGRWGERLSQGLTHAVGADLAARMPQYSIVQDGSGTTQRQLRVTISALDLWPEGRCVLAANWSIVDPDSSIPMTTGSGTFETMNAGGPAAVSDANLVEAIARTLGKLADSIVSDAQASPERADVRGTSKTLTAD
jgi:uncharacterized lipoprotein YmbA